MIWHVFSGEMKMQVDAPTVKTAFIKALRVADLETCNRFIGAFEHGGSRYGDKTLWSLTEFYLAEAGYTDIGGGLWRKQDTGDDLSSTGGAGRSQKRGKDAGTIKPSVKENISTIALEKHSKPDDKPQKMQKRSEREVDSLRPNRESITSMVNDVRCKNCGTLVKPGQIHNCSP